MTLTRAPAGPDQRLPSAYWRLWTASTISNLGDGVFLVALPLMAARLTDSAVSISLVGAFAGLPWLLLSLPIGAIIDRRDRRRLLIRADAVRCLLVGVAALVVASGHAAIWMLWLLALGLGTAEVFFDNASQAILPSIVRPEQLERANGRRYSAEITANLFVGTPLGSLLFAAAVWLPFAFDAISFLVAALLVLSLTGAFRPPERTGPPTSLGDDVRVGLRWLWDHRTLRGLAIALGLSNFGFQMSQAVFVLFAKQRLHITDREFGFLLAVIGVGSIIGGLVGDRIVRHLGRLPALYGSIVIWAAALVAFGAFPVTWLVIVVSAIEALAVTVWNVTTVSLRQQIIPNELFGRVNSVYRWFGWGTIPLGALAGGQVASHFGLRAPYFVGAAVVALALVVVLRSVSPGAVAGAIDERQRATASASEPADQATPRTPAPPSMT